MTQIQATVSVKDNIDAKIEQKLKAIGTASENTARQLNSLQQATRSISSQPVNLFANAVNSLSRTNLTSLRTQMQQLSSTSVQLGNGLTSQATSAVKLQIAQTKLQQEQTKLALIQQRLQTTSTNTSIAQQRLATASSNASNAQARLATALTRTQTAKTQSVLATVRLQQAQLRLEQQMRRTATAGQSQGLTIRSLMSTFGAVSGMVAGAIGITKMGDDYQRMINKLSLVTNSADEARNRLATLGQVALNSHAGLESTTQLYTRLDLALKQTGGSSADAIQMTQTLSKAVSLAGLTTSEANSALLQISQAFNKGKLDGDEFRTVMETMPPLADAIARQLGVTRGELLKLAPEGKITGEVMRKAVLEMSESVDQKFASLTPTVAMHLQNLQTQAQMYFGGMFKDSGLASAFGSAINLIANNLDTATRMAVAFGVAVTLAMGRTVLMSFAGSVMTVASAIGKASGAMGIFNAVMRASPIGLFITAVTALGFILDSVFDGAISRTIFPNFEQDQAKANDYMSRLHEVDSQMAKMSYHRLKQEQILLDQSMGKTNEKLTEQKTKLADVQQQLANKEKALVKAKKELEAYQSGTKSAIDMTAGWGFAVNEQAIAQEKVANLIKEITDLRADEVNIGRDVESTNTSLTEGYQTQIGLLEQQIERIDSAKVALEGKTQKDIEASAELQAQKAIVDDAGVAYSALKVQVIALKGALNTLLGTSSKLGGVLQEGLEQTQTELSTQIIKKINDDIEWKKKYASATVEQQKDMDARKKLAKEIEQLNQDPKAKEKVDELVKSYIDAENAIEARNKADAEARQNERKAQSEADKARKKAEREKEQAKKKAQREEEKRVETLQKAKEEHEQYLQGLEDEAMLLGQGLQNYNKYKDVYSLKIKLQQKGYDLNEQQIQQLKQKIDANERLKNLAKEINTFEENSLARKREDIALKWEALSKADISDSDRRIGADSIYDSVGFTSNANQGVEQIKTDYQLKLDALKQYQQQVEMSETEFNMRMQGLAQQRDQAIYEQQIKNLENMGGMYAVMGTAISTFEQNATNSIMNVLNGTESISDAMRNLAKTIATSVVQAIVQMGVRWIAYRMAMAVTGQTADTMAVTSATATGSAIASAYAPAAAIASMATSGGSATAGMGAMLAGMALVPALLAKVSGQRRYGGTVNAGELYQVGEGNAPEIYQSKSGRQYMIAGDNGRVFSNKQVMSGGGGRVVHITQNVTINGNGQLDTDTLMRMKEQTRQVVYEVLTDENRDAGGMLA